MAITINGSSNTITGIAVGGLPDGIVDTDMIAAGAVTAPKRGAGAILQVAQTTATGEVLSNSASDIVGSGHICSITPVGTGSKFFVQADGITAHFNRNTESNSGSLYYLYVSVNSGTYANVTSTLIQNVYVNGDFGSWMNVPLQFSFLASPSYSAGQTVAFQPYYKRAPNSSGNFYYHHQGPSAMANQVRTLTVMEVAA
jgi:hypothetical protein